jgi:predicted AAA+ superfamily ATPase
LQKSELAGKLVSMQYVQRISDRQIQKYLKLFGAVLIEGPKWCGKTWAARHSSRSEFALADPTGNFRNREIAMLNPDAALQGAHPHLIDEWQEVPMLWDAVRYAIDRDPAKGQFMLTGSSTPDDDRYIHSGTGRFGRVRLETMSLVEMGLASPNISLEGLFDGSSAFEDGEHLGTFSISNITEIICKGGWPALLGFSPDDASVVISSYLDDAAGIDISRIDDVKRDPDKVKALLKSLARNAATTVKYATVSSDISGFSSVTISDDTVAEYMSLLKRLFLLRDIPAWEPALKSTVRLRTSPKRILADASLAANALGAIPRALEADPKLTGSFFENLVLHNLIVYASGIGAEVRHYQDSSGLEVDAIVEKRDGSWGGLEIKLGYHQVDEAAASLLRLKKKLQDGNQKPPSFLGVIVGVAGLARRRSDGVLVIPIDHLGC